MKTFTTEEFIQKAKEVHGNKYDYSLVDYKNAKTKVKIICPIHGEFEQKPNDHLNKRGCRKCGYEKNIKNNSITTEEFIKRAKEVHGDKYDYSLVDKSITTHKNIKIICPIHGEFEQIAWNHLCGHGCSICSKKVYSKGEKNIRNFLLNNNIDFQQQKTFEDLKDKYKLSYDFYIPSKNLLIEYNGEQHYKKSSFKHHDLKMQRHHDWLKRKYAKKNNIELLTIPYWNFKIINEILEEKLNVRARGEVDTL